MKPEAKHAAVWSVAVLFFAAVAPLAVFLGFAFAHWSADPADWHSYARGIAALLVVVAPFLGGTAGAEVGDYLAYRSWRSGR